MGEGEYEHVEVSKKGRHRKKQLYNSILKLMEFYFSDSNLAKDRFLSQLINEDPYIDLSTFLKFNRIKKLNCDIEDIRKAISKSDLIELSDDREKVKRKLPIKLNQNVDNCTVYVENIKADADHEWVSQFFLEFGNVVYVSIPKYKHNKTNKGFAFVEFENEQGAKNALTYFETIGCKMPSETSPENLKSIQTFEEKTDMDVTEEKCETKIGEKSNVNVKEEKCETKIKEKSNVNVKEEKCEMKIEEKSNLNVKEEISEKKELSDLQKSTKRKLEDEELVVNKKIKVEDVESEPQLEEHNQIMEAEDTDSKKKKKHKKDKKKNIIKELGIQVLSKPEWKKMRNRYLDLQKKKMKEFKQYLNRQRFAQRSYDKNMRRINVEIPQIKDEPKEKLEFVSGVIVKVMLPEPVIDAKKIKNDIKVLSSDIKYVDIPLPAGSEEIFVRFSNNKDAKDFCSKGSIGDKAVLEGDEEQMYWEKIQADRDNKFSKNVKKQRGRDKLLKKAEKERAKHIKFEEGE